jgi:hypothetical protein
MHVELVARTAQFEASMNEAGKRAEEMSKKLNDMGTAMSKRVTAPILAAGAAALTASVQVGNFADRLLDLSDMTGLSTDELQRFRALATQAGVGADTIANAVQRLTVRMASGEEGSADLRNGLTQLGIAMEDATGATRPMGSVVEEALSKLASMEDVTQRNVTAVRLFGRSAAELAPVLALGSDGMADAIARAEELGLIMSNDALRGANDFRVEWDNMKATMAGAAREIGMAVMPAMRVLVDIMNDHLLPAFRAAIKVVSDLDPRLVIAAGAVAGLAAAIGPALIVLATMVKSVTLLAGAFATLNVALATGGVAAMIGGGGIIVALGLAAAGAYALWRNLRGANKELAKMSPHASTVALNLELLAALGPKVEEPAAAVASLGDELVVTAVRAERAAQVVETVLVPAVGAASEGLLRMHRVELPSTVAGLASAEMATRNMTTAVNQQADAHDRLNNAMNRGSRILSGLGSLGGVFGLAIPGLGQAGGILSSLRSFAGGFADGGRIPGGQWGVVGERGPEIVTGPAQITPMTGGGGDVVLSVQIVGQDGRAATDAITVRQKRDDRLGRTIRIPLDKLAVVG